MIGTGGVAGGSDAANILKTALTRVERCKKYCKNNGGIPWVSKQ